jgi:RHS repeat-associated protein
MKSNGTIYWYGANSASLEESDLSGNIQRLYYFFDGQRIGRSLPSNEVGFYMTDALGNVRVLGGCCTGYQLDYYSFGGVITDSDTGDDRYQFTGKERDPESGLDNFGARYNSSSMGRWMSPDAINLTDARVQNPANTLNKYVYGGNNPLKYIDPDGRDITVFYSGGGPAGHFWAVAYNQSTGDSAALNFGPKNSGPGTRLGELVGAPVQGDTNYASHITSLDEMRQDFSSLTIQTNPEDAQKAIDSIRNFNSQDHNYTTYGTNCTTVCKDVLQKILGLESNSIQPTALWEDIFVRWSDRYLNWKPCSDRGGCAPGVAYATGKDYGRPRYPFNTFDFVWLLMHPQKACTTILVPDGSGGSKPETKCD